MARKRPNFFRSVKAVLNSYKTYAQRIGLLILFLLSLSLTVGLQIYPGTAQALAPAQLMQQGRANYEAGKLEDAIAPLQQAIAGFAARGEHLQQAIALSNLSLVYQQLGQWASAETTMTQSLGLLGTSPQTLQSKNLPSLPPQSTIILAQVLDLYGRFWYDQGQPEQALKIWQQAAQLYQPQSDRLGKANNQLNQVQALQALGLFREAQKHLLTKVLGFTQDEALGFIEPESSSLLDSQLDRYKLLLPRVRNALPEAGLQITTLRQLGNIYLSLGDYEAAIALLQAAQKQIESQPPSAQIQSITSEILLSLGNVYQAQFNRDRELNLDKPSTSSQIQNSPAIEALEYYQQAGESSVITTQLQAQVQQFNLLATLAEWQQTTGRSIPTRQNLSHWLTVKTQPSQSPLENLQQQLAALPANHWQLYTQISLIQTQLRLLKLRILPPTIAPELKQHLSQVVNAAQTLQDSRSEVYALGLIGQLYEIQARQDTSRWQDAEKYTTAALYQAQQIPAPEITYQWQWQLGRIQRDRTDEKQNLQGAIVSYEGAVTTLNAIRGNLLGVNAEVQFSFRDNVEPVYRELVDLLLKTSSPELSPSKETNEDQLKKAVKLIDKLQLAELQNFLQCDLTVSISDDQNDDPTAAIFYPIILDDRLEVIVQLPELSSPAKLDSKQGKLNYRLIRYDKKIDRQQLETQLIELRKVLARDDAGNDEIEPIAGELYKWLIQPVVNKLSALGIKTLVFVSDGVLRNLPMAVLWDQDSNKFLVEKYALATSPGLKLFRGAKFSKAESLRALVAGLRNEKKVTVSGSEFNFEALEAVDKEAAAILEILPNSKKLLDQEFQVERLQNYLSSNAYPIVHLATHGWFSSDPRRTFLVTNSEPLSISQLQNLLQSTSSEENLKMLVLSACETAKGDKRATLGLAGVAVRAGALSTVASLWRVNDNSTYELMKVFYQKLRQQTAEGQHAMSKAEALRQAQLSLLHFSKQNLEVDYSKPYYWSAFVLVGNWL